MRAEIVSGGATSDDHLVALWLHGRSAHTARAYQADVDRLRAGVGKPLARVNLRDLQGFADKLSGLAPASRYRILSAVKSLLALGHRVGLLAFDVGRVLHLRVGRYRLTALCLPS